MSKEGQEQDPQRGARRKAKRSHQKRNKPPQSHTPMVDGHQSSSSPASVSSPPSPPTYTIPDLPVEILQRIFMFCTATWLPSPWPFGKRPPWWIKVTHVCRYWRAVALSYHSLWATTPITSQLGFRWAKTFIERSEPALIDINILVGPRESPRRNMIPQPRMAAEDVIAILTGFSRMGSLSLHGRCKDIRKILDALSTPTPIHTFSLFLNELDSPVVLPEGLFGGQAPIRHLQLFFSSSYIIAPRSLLSGITHFTCAEKIPFLDLLQALRQMRSLAYFALKDCSIHWKHTDAPREPRIEMPHLMDFVVHMSSPHFFALLNSRLVLPAGARRALYMHTAILPASGWSMGVFAAISPVIEAGNGIQHIYLRGVQEKGTFEARTAVSTAESEVPAFRFNLSWCASPQTMNGEEPDPSLVDASPIFHVGELCDLLGATAWARTLELGACPGDLPKSYWWRLLSKLNGIEKLELHDDAVECLGSAWEGDDAPSVLPRLESVCIVQRKFGPGPNMTFEIRRRGRISRVGVVDGSGMGFSERRRITWVPNTLESAGALGAATGEEIESEKVPEGLIRLLQGERGQSAR